MTHPISTRVEMIYDDGVVEWTGPVDDLDITEFTETELDMLFAQGYVVVGGGAAPIMTIRFCCDDSCEVPVAAPIMCACGKPSTGVYCDMCEGEKCAECCYAERCAS